MSAKPRAKAYTLEVDTAFPRDASAWEKCQHLVSIAGPIGWIPWVPATFASAAVALLCWLWPPSGMVVIALTVALFFLGSATATTSERVTGASDPRNVVIDEVAGQLLAFVAVAPVNWKLAVAGFALFRVFDVVKPPPARQAERLPGGWGIMTDDIVAGGYAALALWLVRGWLR